MRSLIGFILIAIGVLWLSHLFFNSFMIGLMYINTGIRIITHHISLIIGVLIILYGIRVLRN